MAKQTIADTPARAFNRYAEPLKAVLRCVTDASIINSAHPTADTGLKFAFFTNPARLAGSPYALFLVQYIRIIPDPDQAGCWRVKTLSYEYNIEVWESRQEVICFHWNGQDLKNPHPHIHIGWATSSNGTHLGPKSHIPSGRISVEDVVRFAVDELGVQPSGPFKTRWRHVVDASRKTFEQQKSW